MIASWDIHQTASTPRSFWGPLAYLSLLALLAAAVLIGRALDVAGALRRRSDRQPSKEQIQQLGALQMRGMILLAAFARHADDRSWNESLDDWTSAVDQVLLDVLGRRWARRWRHRRLSQPAAAQLRLQWVQSQPGLSAPPEVPPPPPTAMFPMPDGHGQLVLTFQPGTHEPNSQIMGLRCEVELDGKTYYSGAADGEQDPETGRASARFPKDFSGAPTSSRPGRYTVRWSALWRLSSPTLNEPYSWHTIAERRLGVHGDGSVWVS